MNNLKKYNFFKLFLQSLIDKKTIDIDENGSMYLKAFPHYSTGYHMILNLGGQGSR